MIRLIRDRDFEKNDTKYLVVKCGLFVGQLNHCCLLNKDFVPWS